MKKALSIVIVLGALAALLSPLIKVEAAFVSLGKGCTTAYYIDKDCDGYGVGKKASGIYPLGETDVAGQPYTVPTGDMQDADDNDSTVNTTVSWEAKWGSDNQSIINFLSQKKGFTNTSRIFYISQSGDNATAVVNDPSRPYKTASPILLAMKDLQGGAVIIRGGTWPNLSFTPCEDGNPCYNLTGTAEKPVYVLAYPGEKVETLADLTTAGLTYWPQKNVGYVTYDGIIWRAPNYYRGNGISFHDSNHLAFRNVELAGWTQTLVGNHTEDFLFEDSVCHDMAEHCIYTNSYGMKSYGAADFDFADDEVKYQSGTSPGASYRPRILNNVMYNNGISGYEPIHINTYVTGAVIEGNIVSYGGGTGLGLQSGVYNASVKNNIFFNNGRCAITLSLYGPDTQAATMRGNVIENNIMWTGKQTDSIRGTNPGCGIVMNDYSSSEGHWIKETIIRNNIIVTDNYSAQWGNPTFSFLRNSYPDSHIIENNLIWSSAVGASEADRIMKIDAKAYPDGHDAGNYNFSQFHAYNANYRNNIYADPKFADVSLAYKLIQEKFNFNLLAGSPAIDAGTVIGAPTTDLRGNIRVGNPDIGALEFTDVVSVPLPVTVKYHLSDFINLVSNWLKNISSSVDINGDNKIDSKDLGKIMSNWE